MRYVSNGPLKVYRNKRRADKTRTKSTETTLITPASIHTNKTKHIRCNIMHIYLEAIVLKLIFSTLAAGLHQVT